MEFLWCSSCYLVYKKGEKCYFCKNLLVSLNVEAVREKGKWHVCCARGQHVSPPYPEQIVGRDNPHTGFLFPERDSYVSREHILLKAAPPNILVQDKNSSNGTFLFDENTDSGAWKRLTAGEEASLASGEEIRLGRECLCRVFLQWVPDLISYDLLSRSHKSAHEILLAWIGATDLGAGVRIFFTKDRHFLEDITKDKDSFRVAVNRRLVALTPLQQGDRILLGEEQYEYAVKKLLPAAPLEAPTIQFRNVVVPKRLEIADLTFAESQFTGLIGESGAGKSTLLKVMTGWISVPQSALEIQIQGKKISLREMMAHMAFVPNYDIVWEDLALENSLLLSAFLYGGAKRVGRTEEKIEQILSQVGLTDVRKKRIRDLSSGQKKRVNIASQLVREKASLWILDEPTSGLDLAHDRKIMKLLHQLCRQGRTVICATHHLANMEFFDRIVALQKGTLHHQGSPAEVAFLSQSLLGESHWENLYAAEEKEEKEEKHEKGYLPSLLRVSHIAPWVLFLRRCEEWWHPQGLWQNLLSLILVIPLLIGIMIILAKPFAGIGEETRFFLSSVAAFWLGMSLGSQELRKSRYRIFLHEKALGVRCSAFLLLYFCFYFFVSLAQTVPLVLPSLFYMQSVSLALLFFSFSWAMGLAGSMTGITFSLLESRFKISCAVSVPCFTVMQLLFSEMVMGQISGASYFSFSFDNLRDFLYCLTFSRYPDMAYRAYRNALEGIPKEFYQNLLVFFLFFIWGLVLLYFFLRKASLREQD